MYDLTGFQVGDEFALSPSELGRVISAILAVGGTFVYEGETVTITHLPVKESSEG